MTLFKPCLIDSLAFGDSDESFEAAALEYEFEVYLKGFDFDQVKLLATSYAGQEQWGIPVKKVPENASGGSLRVRKYTIVDGSVTHEFTTKLTGDSKGRPEVNQPTSSDQFELFQQMADSGLIKTRYLVPHEINGHAFNFEVDVFYNARGEMVEWLKIDAEVPQGIKITVADIPFRHTEIIIIDPKIKEQNPNGINEKIGELYVKFFRSSNPLVS